MRFQHFHRLKHSKQSLIETHSTAHNNESETAHRASNEAGCLIEGSKNNENVWCAERGGQCGGSGPTQVPLGASQMSKYVKTCRHIVLLLTSLSIAPMAVRLPPTRLTVPWVCTCVCFVQESALVFLKAWICDYASRLCVYGSLNCIKGQFFCKHLYFSMYVGKERSS